MIEVMLLVLLLLLLYSNSITPHWTLTNITPVDFCITYTEGSCLETHSPISDNDTIVTMQEKNFFFFSDWGCLSNAHQPRHCVVKFSKLVSCSFIY